MSIEDLGSGKEDVTDSFEVLKTPEILIQKEYGAQLFSLILKAQDPQWGETETPLAREVTEYFNQNPLPPNILDLIEAFKAEGVDEETLYNMALTYQHPERTEHVLEMAKEYKPYVKDPMALYTAFISALEEFDGIYSDSSLAPEINDEIEKDRERRLEGIDVTEKRIKELIDFYLPDVRSTDISRVSFVPTDPLYRKNSGRAFSAFPGEQIIISHIDNIDNQDHEFCHGIINPIVRKLSDVLTEEQKNRVSQLASGKLREDYGEGYFSLLCEEFIRTYNDVIKKGEQLPTYDDFYGKISSLTEEEFDKFSRESENLRNRLGELEINTLEDFKRKSREYYERFEKNELRELVYGIYQEYMNRPDKDGVNFEMFVLSKFADNL